MMMCGYVFKSKASSYSVLSYFFLHYCPSCNPSNPCAQDTGILDPDVKQQQKKIFIEYIYF